MLPTKFTYTNHTNPTDYYSMVSIFAKSTSMCFTNYNTGTDPIEVPSPTSISPPHLDIKNFSSLLITSHTILLPKQYSSVTTFQPSNLPTSYSASNVFRLYLPLFFGPALSTRSNLVPWSTPVARVPKDRLTLLISLFRVLRTPKMMAKE